MKEFKVYVGLWEENMTEVLHAGLKNDPFPETFTIRSMNEASLTFPTQYIKIEPLT
jgi:muskelin